MLTWITVWVLTVTHNESNTLAHAGYGVGYSYQLQYKDKATCLRESEKHKERRVVKTSFLEPTSYLDKNNRVRCDMQQIPVYK